MKRGGLAIFGESLRPPKARPNVFISFKTEEREAARLLKDALSAEGFGVWWQEEIQCGQEWHGEIDTAIASAGCIVVLWSARAMNSPWVCHEASQAIARAVYAPARLEPIEIESPYDRLQATDLIRWDGNPNHHGFQGVLKRVKELIPEVRSPLAMLWDAAKANLGLMLTILIASAAMALLLQQSMNMSRQLDRQAELAIQIERTLQPISGVSFRVEIAVPPQVDGAQAYTELLRLALTDPSTKSLRAVLPDGVHVTFEGLNGEKTVEISPESLLWPKKKEDWLLYHTVLEIDLSVRFKRGTEITEFARVNPASKYDLGMDIGSFNPDGSTDDDSRIAILWNLHDNKLAVSFSDTPSTRYWYSNGSIVSVPDLEKSIIKFAIMNTMVRVLGNKSYQRHDQLIFAHER